MRKVAIAERKYLSEVKTSTLDNGLRIYTLGRHDVPAVSIQAWIGTGSMHEGRNLGCGLSHFLEHMLFQGCAGYPGMALSDLVNQLGGYVNAYTSYSQTCYHIDLPSKHLRQGLDLISAMISAPEFPVAKFKKESKVILRERDMAYDRPERRLSELMFQESFLINPVRHPIIGYREKIEQVTREMMMEYYYDRYIPARSFITVFGDIDEERTVSILNRKLGKWRRGNLENPVLPREPEQQVRRERTEYFTDPLARIAMSYKIGDICSPDNAAVNILAAIIGGGNSSRLMRTLCMEKELAIDISAGCSSSATAGLMYIWAVCAPEKRLKLEEALRVELAQIAAGDIAPAELAREKTQATTEYLRGMRTSAGIAGLVGAGVSAWGTATAAEYYLELLQKVSIDDVKRAATQYLRDDHSTICRVLPEAVKQEVVSSTADRQAKHQPQMHRLTGKKIRLVEYYKPELPLVDVSMIIPGGTFCENPANAGISNLATTMLGAGTKRWNEIELAKILETNAIQFSAVTNRNSMIIQVNCPADRFELSMDILKSILTESTFGAKEFRREQDNLIKSLESRAMSPRVAAANRMLEINYGPHPYSIPPSGKIESIAKLTPKLLRDFFNSKLIPDQTVFGIAGDYDREVALKAFTKLMDAVTWQKESTAGYVIPPVFPVEDYYERLVLPREQSSVCCSLPGCEARSPDADAVSIILDSLNGLSSQLFKKVREDAALAYSVGVDAFMGFHPGLITFHAGTQASSESKALALINEERLRLAEQGLNQAEFDAAKNAVMFDIARQTETPGLLILQSILAEYYGDGFMHPWRKIAHFRKLSRNEVNRIAAKYFHRDVPAVTIIAGKEQEK